MKHAENGRAEVGRGRDSERGWMARGDGEGGRGSKGMRGDEAVRDAHVAPVSFFSFLSYSITLTHSHPTSLDDDDAPHHNTRTTRHPPLPCKPLLAGWITGGSRVLIHGTSGGGGDNDNSNARP